MVSGCGRCGAKLDIQRSRRPAIYCSAACRQAAYRARKVPAAVRDRDRWVSWKQVRRGGRPTKMPIQVTGKPASSTDPATWTSYASVKPLQRKGFALGDGIGCIDLDHCLVDGRPTKAAAAFLAKLPPTWIEISPSGDGLHIWGHLPEGPGSKRTVAGLSIEVYSSGRYITVTGLPFAGSVPRLADLSGISA